MESLLDLTLPHGASHSGFLGTPMECGSSGESGTSFRMQECACRFLQRSQSAPVPAVISIVNIGTMRTVALRTWAAGFSKDAISCILRSLQMQRLHKNCD